MKKVLRKCGFFGHLEQERLLKAFTAVGISGYGFTVKPDGNDYYLISETSYYIAYFHICMDCNPDIILLNEAHQTIIENNAMGLFDRQLLKNISWNTVVLFNNNHTECYLYDSCKLFAYANSDGEKYDCGMSELSGYKRNLLCHIFDIRDGGTEFRDDFRLMRCIAETPDFTLEYRIADLLSFSCDSAGYTLHFSENRKSQYSVDINHLVLKKSSSKFLTSVQLAEQHIAQLRQFLLERKHHYVITLPSNFTNQTALKWLHCLCASRGYGIQTNNNQYVITTYVGESDSKDEFSEFQTAEQFSQNFINTTERKIMESENNIICFSSDAAKSQTFRKWLDNHCKKYQFTYSIKDNLITIVLFP